MIRATRDQKGIRETKVTLATRVSRAIKAPKVIREIKVILVTRDPKVIRAIKVIREIPVKKAIKAIPAWVFRLAVLPVKYSQN